MFNIVDELATIPKNILGPFEGNVDDGKPTIMVDMEHNISTKNQEDIEVDLVRLYNACKPFLYMGAWSTKLSTTMLMMDDFIVHGVNNKCVDELLLLSHKYILPLDNCLPTNMFHAKFLTLKVGLNYKVIHACINRCVLFWGEYANLMTHPKWEPSQHKNLGMSNIPSKVMLPLPSHSLFKVHV